MIRRLFGQFGTVAIARIGWQHRGSLVRATDLLLRIPARLRNGQAGEAVTEAKAIARLDGAFGTDVNVRLESLADGQVILRDGLDAGAVRAVRAVLAPMAGIIDIRTDVAHQPTVDDALAVS